MNLNFSTEEKVVGIQAVAALLKNNPRKIDHLIFLQNSREPQLYELQKTAKKEHIRSHQLPVSTLDAICRRRHQGVIALLNARALDSWSEVKKGLLLKAETGQLPPAVAMLAAIEDPRNFGACIRSAAGFNMDAVLFPDKGSCGLTDAAARTSAGSSDIIPISRLHNVEQELNSLKTSGFTIYGLDHQGSRSITEEQYQGPCIFVIGGEDRSIPPHIIRACDKLIQIPIFHKAHSFNSSVALSLMLYEYRRQSGFNALFPSKNI